MIKCLTLLLTLMVALPIDSAEPLIKTKLEEKSAHWSGEKVTFYVEIYSPTWFAGKTRFKTPDSTTAIIHKSPGSPTLGSTTIDDDNYTFQRHEFSVFCRRNGSITVPSIDVEFGVAVPGKKPIRKKLSTKPFKINIKTPAELKGKSYVTTPNYDVDISWDQDIKETKFKVGDALTLKIDRKARNTLSMLLPSYKPEKVEGVAIYPSPSHRNDEQEREEFLASITEEFSYVFEKEGTVIMPEIVFLSWDPKTQKVKSEKFKAFSLKIVANPLFQKKDKLAKTQTVQNDKHYIITLIAMGVILLLIIHMKKRKLQTAEITEKSQFKVLIGELKNGKNPDIYRSINQWVEFASKGKTFEALLQEYNKDLLLNEYHQLTQSIFGKQGPINRDTIIQEITELRHDIKAKNLSQKSINKNPFVLHKTKLS